MSRQSCAWLCAHHDQVRVRLVRHGKLRNMAVKRLIANRLVFVATLAIVVFLAPRLAAQAPTEAPQPASPRAPHVNASPDAW